MGLFTLLPIAALAMFIMSGHDAVARDAAMATATADPGFELLVSGQSLAAALFLFAGIRLARGRRRRS